MTQPEFNPPEHVAAFERASAEMDRVLDAVLMPASINPFRARLLTDDERRLAVIVAHALMGDEDFVVALHNWHQEVIHVKANEAA